jgi:hypothetical protein
MQNRWLGAGGNSRTRLNAGRFTPGIVARRIDVDGDRSGDRLDQLGVEPPADRRRRQERA